MCHASCNDYRVRYRFNISSFDRRIFYRSIDDGQYVCNRCPVSKRFAFRIREMMDRRVIQCHCSTRESCRREERCERVKVGWQETNVKGEGSKTGRIFRGKAYLEKNWKSQYSLARTYRGERFPIDGINFNSKIHFFFSRLNDISSFIFVL